MLAASLWSAVEALWNACRDGSEDLHPAHLASVARAYVRSRRDLREFAPELYARHRSIRKEEIRRQSAPAFDGLDLDDKIKEVIRRA